MTSDSLTDPRGSIDDLDRAIVNLAARINAASHDLLVLIRRFDERAGWLRWGFENCADWLHWRCDLSLSAAREKVRVAHAVDHAALTRGTGRSGLPIESVRRLACDGERVVVAEDENGEPLSVGRKTRIVPAAIRRALWARDKGCRFPGCTHRRYVDAHHIEHWSAGGETRLGNLMLLCTQHHRLVHEDGFRIEKDYRDRWFFKRPDGRAVPACGYRPEDVTDDDVDTAGEYFHAHAHASAEVYTQPSALRHWSSPKRMPPSLRPTITAARSSP